MNKAFIIAIVIILIGGVIYFVFAKNSQKQTQIIPTTQPTSLIQQVSPTPSQKNSVSYTDNGFTPPTITIKKGDTVTWTNNSAGDMWVASDPHPTHTDYPGFDELKSATNGQTYTFTFTKVGSWGYHNHFKPGNKGTVVVAE